MEIVSLFGSVKNYDKGLLKITNLVNNTLAELGMPVKELNLGPPTTVPYYDGIKSQVAAEFINEIKNASGLIIATTAGICGVSSVLQTFLEHLEVEPDVLKHKNCMLIVLSTAGETSTINSLSKTVTSLGGYDSVRIFLDEKFFGTQNNKELVEKQIEDFYRMVRQKRKFYTPKVGKDSHAEYPMVLPTQPPHPQPYVPPTYVADSYPEQYQEQYQMPQQAAAGSGASMQQPQHTSTNVYQGSFMGGQRAVGPQLAQPQHQPTFAPDPVARYSVPPPPNPMTQNSTPYNSSVIDNFNKRQDEDIQEITSFFSKKYNAAPEPVQEIPTQYRATSMARPTENTATAMPSQKTPRQITASLIHHYQPQLAGDLNCSIQLNISGASGFDGYILVNGMDCSYYDGNTNNPTLTVISNENDWIRVITGKVSAQKAFMTGSLKIKGNFVMLTRFDQIFNTSKNYA
ncbi:MAG: SCP2 sterol-binding domain-containing protein [Defluviitaleaceae bacterium]|nr:SCP2 sterol-binding domain-containing protein [Defluviitaleaceae bacterium]